jgi:hypothetical protein
VRSLLAGALVAVVCVPAAAALDPGMLVLRQSDVPAGFELDRDESGVRSNARRMRDTPELRSLFRRAGRVTGYEATFLRFDRSDLGLQLIESHADLLRATSGAAAVLAEFDRQAVARLRTQTRLRRSRVGVGDAGWRYAGKTTTPFALVAWRYGRVFAVVFTLNLSPDQTLALARKQERRIAAALR